MLKKIFLLLTVIFMSGTYCVVCAMTCHSDSGNGEHAQVAKNTANIGNKICPVTGEKINEKMKATYEYAGKSYNFCCASCIDDFKKDPDKYVKKVEISEKNIRGHKH